MPPGDLVIGNNQLQGILTALQANGQLLGSIQQAIKGLQTAISVSYLAAAWTPTLLGDGTAGTPTYTVQVGAYEQVGRRVTATFNVAISATTGMVGNLLIGGLPLASANTANDFGVVVFGQYLGITLDAGFTQLGGIVSANSATAKVVESGSTKTPTALPLANVAATTQLVGMISYHI